MPLIATRGAASAQGFGEFSAVGPANYIEDVFSTYLYTGTNATQTITNGIDLAGKGGLVWIKSRSAAENHFLFDTLRGVNKYLQSQNTDAQSTVTNTLSAFNTNGFTLGTNGPVTNNVTYASWTFREQAKFFDIVTYTGNGANRTIAHNLGSVPGCIIVKCTSLAGTNWAVYHRSLTSAQYALQLNNTGAQLFKTAYWNSTAPTSTVFSLGNDTDVNQNGATYVAYLFAHNAGGFGLTGTDNVISCGSFTTSASGYSSINLGWEPQWVLIKTTGVVQNWFIFDNMRGFPVTGNSPSLSPNLSNPEDTTVVDAIRPTATGFDINADYFGGNRAYIYIAIRRGPMKVPTLGTSVFSPVVYAGTGANQTISGNFPSDLSIFKATNSNAISWAWVNRLAGGNLYLRSNSTAGEGGLGANAYGQVQNGVTIGGDTETNSSSSSYVLDSVRRAPGFFDVVCYTGDSTLGRAVPHNLGAVPELMIVKNRNNTENWVVYSATTGATKRLILNSTAAAGARAIWADTTPTSTNFYVGGSGVLGETNYTTYTYVAYLFATVPGVSKAGSYTGNGTTQQINCGFTGGARFVLIKRTDSTGDWYVWDTARGIVAGNDPYLVLNTTAAEVTNTDYIDTYSAGFEISSTAPAAINANGGTYIFLAIA